MRTKWAVACWLLAATSGSAQDVRVVGESPNNRLLIWTVTNDSRYGVSYFELPIHGVNRVEAPPEGWEVRHFDRLTQGKLIFASTSRRYDIAPGRSSAFKCMLHQRGLALRPGTALVGLRKGAEIEKTEVPDVLLPVAQSFLEVYGLPLFLGLLLVVFALWRLFKGRRASSESRGPGSDRGLPAG